MRTEHHELLARVMGRINGDSFYRHCPDCGARQRVDIDTDGAGDTIERPEPCPVCGARNGLPPDAVLRGDTLVEVAARLMVERPDALHRDIYEVIRGLGYELSLAESSFLYGGYAQKAQARAEELRARRPGRTYETEDATVRVVRTERKRYVLVVEGPRAIECVREMLEAVGAREAA